MIETLASIPWWGWLVGLLALIVSVTMLAMAVVCVGMLALGYAYFGCCDQDEEKQSPSFYFSVGACYIFIFVLAAVAVSIFHYLLPHWQLSYAALFTALCGLGFYLAFGLLGWEMKDLRSVFWRKKAAAHEWV